MDCDLGPLLTPTLSMRFSPFPSLSQNMESLHRSESSGAAAAAALELALMPVIESVSMEAIWDAGKSVFWLLCMMASLPSAVGVIGEGSPLSSLGTIKGESVPENKDDGESDEDDDEDDDDEAGDQDDDGGEEDYSGEEGNEDDDEDEVEANGGRGGSGDDDDDDEDDEDDDEDGDDDDDEEEDEEEQPPSKKRK